MRIAHVITGLDTGGAEMMLCRLAQRLAPSAEQHVISLTDLGPVAALIGDAGVHVEALGLSPARPNPLKLIELAWRLRRLRPDVVLTWLYHADLIGGLAARLAGLRRIAWNIRNNDVSRERSNAKTLRVVQLLARLSRAVPSRIVTCSQAALQTHAALGYAAEKFVVIPNGFDLNRFKPDPEARQRIRAELGLDDATPLVGLFARHDPQKNHRGFVAAAAFVHGQRPDVHFVLAGRGIDASNADLQDWIRAAGIEGKTHVLGERGDMPALNAAIDVAASTSFGEAFSNALGEAMACGIPCVATDAGDAALIVGDTGAIVNRGNMQAWANACLSMLNLPRAQRIALGEAARRRIATMFDLDDIATRYATLLADLALKR